MRLWWGGGGGEEEDEDELKGRVWKLSRTEGKGQGGKTREDRWGRIRGGARWKKKGEDRVTNPRLITPDRRLFSLHRDFLSGEDKGWRGGAGGGLEEGKG